MSFEQILNLKKLGEINKLKNSKYWEKLDIFATPFFMQLKMESL